MTNQFATTLPPHGVPMLIPEIVSRGSDMDGRSVRVVGRVDSNDVTRCIALIAEPGSKSQSSTRPVTLAVDTSLTDASDYRLGSQVMLIGEMEICEEPLPLFNENTGNIILKARVSRCVDRLDYALYCRSVDVWRKYNSAETT